jgi:hypothetical protein
MSRTFTRLPLSPYSRLTAEFASILLPAFSLFVLVAPISHVCVQKALIY